MSRVYRVNLTVLAPIHADVSRKHVCSRAAIRLSYEGAKKIANEFWKEFSPKVLKYVTITDENGKELYHYNNFESL